MKGKESSKVSGHFDEDIPRYLTEGIYTGDTCCNQVFPKKIANLHGKCKKTDSPVEIFHTLWPYSLILSKNMLVYI